MLRFAEVNVGLALSCDAARAIVPILRIDQRKRARATHVPHNSAGDRHAILRRYCFYHPSISMNDTPESLARQIAELDASLAQSLPDAVGRRVEQELATLRQQHAALINLSGAQMGDVKMGDGASSRIRRVASMSPVHNAARRWASIKALSSSSLPPQDCPTPPTHRVCWCNATSPFNTSVAP